MRVIRSHVIVLISPSQNELQHPELREQLPQLFLLGAAVVCMWGPPECGGAQDRQTDQHHGFSTSEPRAGGGGKK